MSIWKNPSQELPIIHEATLEEDTVYESRPVLVRYFSEEPDNKGACDGYQYEVAFYSVHQLDDGEGVWTSLLTLEPLMTPVAWMDIPRDDASCQTPASA